MQEKIAKLRSEPFVAANSKKDLLALAELECWGALEEILSFDVEQSPEENKHRLLLLAQLAVEFRVSSESISAPLLELVTKFKLSYAELEISILEGLRLERSWKLESDLLFDLYESFELHDCKVRSLTRVCFLLEKNGYFGVDLPNYYESLLRLEPSSKEALRFFKVFFLQENRFTEAKIVSEKLIDSLENSYAKATETHELCGIL